MTPAHRIGGVEVEPAPRSWVQALGIVVVALAFAVIPGAWLLWLARRCRTVRILKEE